MKAWPVAAGLLAGIAAGAIWTWVQPDRYRADARILIRPPSARVMPPVETLAESSLVESNIAQTLHLPKPPRVSATRGDGGVLTVSVTAGTRERARQIDAEAVVILTQKVAERFRAAPRVTATVLDPAHASEQTSPTPGRNFLVAGLIGLAGGAAAAALVRQPRRTAAAAVGDPGVERRLRTRIDEVAKRERTLARRAGGLAKRDAELAKRDAELAKRDAELAKRDAELADRERALVASAEDLVGRAQQLTVREAAGAAAVAQAAAAKPAEPEPPVAPPAPAVRGAWNLDELERFVEAHAGAAPDQVEEWRRYLFLLRQHAGADGTLPASFDALVNDVFAGAS